MEAKPYFGEPCAQWRIFPINYWLTALLPSSIPPNFYVNVNDHSQSFWGFLALFLDSAGTGYSISQEGLADCPGEIGSLSAPSSNVNQLKSHPIHQTYSLSGISDSVQLRLLALLTSLSGSHGNTLAIRCWAGLCGVGFYGRTLVIGEREPLGGTGMNLQTPGVAARWAPF